MSGSRGGSKCSRKDAAKHEQAIKEGFEVQRKAIFKVIYILRRLSLFLSLVVTCAHRLYVRFAVFLLVLASPWAFLHFRHGRPSNSGGGAGDVKGQPSKQALLLQHSNTTWAEKGLTSQRTSEWITRTVRDTLSSIKGWLEAFLLFRHACTGFHVNSDDQESEWNAGEISFHVASNSCDSVCQSAGKVCARDWFVFLDRSQQLTFESSRLPDGCLLCSGVTLPRKFSPRAHAALLSIQVRSTYQLKLL